MNIVRLRNTIVISVVAAYLLLNYGFQVVKIPPGRYAIPVGELCLVFAILLCAHRTVLPQFARTGVIYAFGAWWAICLAQLLYAIPNHGFWAFRDASQFIESSFLYLGFCLSTHEIARLKRWTPWFLFVAVLYGLTYPAREFFQQFSPILETSSGGTAYLIFTYISTPTLLILAAFMLIMYAGQARRSERGLLLFLAAGLLGYTVYAFQQRTIYLQILTLVILAVIMNRRFRRLLPAIAVLFIAFLAVFPYFGIDLQGRLGMEAGLGFVVNHLLAIGGVSSEGLEGTAGGVGQRLGWWYGIFLRVSDNWLTALFGLGYGQPLIEFRYREAGLIVREPHNSVMTAFGRTGIAGLTAWLTAQLYLGFVWLKTYRYAVSHAHANTIVFLRIVLFYSALIWVFSLGEDAFEKPFHTVPYYFLWGCALKIRLEQRAREITAVSRLQPAAQPG
ncbi:MAG: hypothetical protein HKO55_10855 [Gammaproteobacteria bacterium]|nr:hypothetical protein [Gammaproteobacteria bacterium]NNM21762.1 hypothetical protein [Gammaproteobacteria bacterium]